MNRSHNADDRQPTRIGVDLQEVSWIARAVHALADGIDAWPELLSERLIDDYGARRRLIVVIVEVSPSHQRRAHGFEVTGRHDHQHGRDQRLAGLHLIALGDDNAVAVVAAEWNDRGSARVASTPGTLRIACSARLVNERTSLSVG